MSVLTSFTGQVAIITGAGQGIGYEIARQLGLQGAKIIINDINGKLSHQAMETLSQEGIEGMDSVGDVSDIGYLEELVSLAVKTYGSLDLVIANAGITSYGKFLSFQEEDFDRLVDVNLKGSFFLVQKAVKKMIELKIKGSCLLMSSVLAHSAYPHLSAYSMSKAGLEMLAKALVIPLSAHGIRINAVAPGATITARTLEDNPDYEKDWKAITPLGGAASLKDIAQAALFLLSEQATHINGQTLIIDGGWTTLRPLPQNL